MTLGLGIDTSFDDTAVALVADGRRILSNLCVSQFAEHSEFGGIVPERASRLHIEMIHPLLEKSLSDTGTALRDLDFVAVTNRPGLIGSLLVGVTTAKALSMALGIPLIGVNHLEAHIYAAFMDCEDLDFPFVSLLISGANTLIFSNREHRDFDVLGGSLDDAVGECIDKCGRFLGLALPAGPAVEKLALEGDPGTRPFPRPMIGSGDLNFSFSGLKTALVYALRDDPDLSPADAAAALLDAIADVLVKKTFRAAAQEGVSTIVLCGGAAANRQIREAFAARGAAERIRVVHPSKILCTDNAAMVAGLAHHLFLRGEHSSLDLPVEANVSWKKAGD